MKRSKDYYRYQREKSIKRKRYVYEHIYQLNDINDKDLGKLAKGKVHCSCGMCSVKTNKDGWKHSDLKKLSKENKFKS